MGKSKGPDPCLTRALSAAKVASNIIHRLFQARRSRIVSTSFSLIYAFYVPNGKSENGISGMNWTLTHNRTRDYGEFRRQFCDPDAKDANARVSVILSIVM